jgi:hypothetical protein
MANDLEEIVTAKNYDEEKEPLRVAFPTRIGGEL